jgi:hypothetical protein
LIRSRTSGVKDWAWLITVGLHKAADDDTRELLGHATIAEIVHVQAVGREIEAVAALTLKLAHGIEAIHHPLRGRRPQ